MRRYDNFLHNGEPGQFETRWCVSESFIFIINEWGQPSKKMVYITQLIYIKEGQEKVFDQFENVAIPMISKYNGRMLLRVRPQKDSFIEDKIDRPYEIHFVEFNSVQDFENFMKDEERKKFLHLKEQSIKSSVLIRGTKI